MSEISAAALVEKFKYAIANQWGYIWGTAGVQWTQTKQTQKVNYMVSTYGTSWQKNSEAKQDKYYSAALYGSKWIGHMVADCSGLFKWAFSQLGGSIAHGSNSIWDRYCTAKGKLSAGKRTDGKELLPGTAVFTGTDSDKPHIGLYVGDGRVVEASGTQAGVVYSNVNAGKWKYWGELKNVEYSNQPEPQPSPEPVPGKGTAVVTGKNVALRQGPGTDTRVIIRIPTGKTVKLKDLPAGWSYVEYNGKTGFMMDEFIRKG